MTSRPAPARNPLTTPFEPRHVVEAFLDALADSDLERAGELLADDVAYTNVGLPTIHGRDAVLRALRVLAVPAASFEVYLHAISATGPTVLTERTDVLAFGRFRAQFWVSGRFDVADGQITLWRDGFDYLDVARAGLRGLAGVALPFLRPSAPGTVPGRH